MYSKPWWAKFISGYCLGGHDAVVERGFTGKRVSLYLIVFIAGTRFAYPYETNPLKGKYNTILFSLNFFIPIGNMHFSKKFSSANKNPFFRVTPSSSLICHILIGVRARANRKVLASHTWWKMKIRMYHVAHIFLILNNVSLRYLCQMPIHTVVVRYRSWGRYGSCELSKNSPDIIMLILWIRVKR